MKINRSAALKYILFILISAAAFYGCSEVPDLSEYQGINYIANSNFTSPEWSFDDTVAPNLFHYMDFDTLPVIAVPVYTGLPNNVDSGDISRLEIFNLVPDGGFESGLAGWNTFGAPTTFTRNNTSNERVNSSIPNNNFSIEYDLFISTDRIQFDLDTVHDGFIENNNYIVRLNFTREATNTTAVFEYNDAAAVIYKTWKPKTLVGWSVDDTVYTEFPAYDSAEFDTNITARPNTQNYFNIGSISYGNDINGYIDDFRIVRSDINYYLRMTVPYSEAGRPDLYSGIYRFAVYVKGEDTADIPPAVLNNRSRSSRVSLIINGKTEGFSSSAWTNTGWTRLTVDKFIQIDAGDTIELMVSPADKSGLANTLDIGSILIASPSLYYISD
ncbi:MAG: hypothetical protein RBT69_10135 [Spirochaetia bacterium]|jgi:hypothetical protein|nr:hypothetical protein [Spirochaetia bacterium]